MDSQHPVKVAHLTSVHRAHDDRILLRECITLKEAGYDVVVIAQGRRDGVVAGIEHKAVPIPRNRVERMTRTAWSVFRRALKERASIYHFHDPELMPIGLLLRLTGAKVIFDVHEDIPGDIRSKPWIPRPMRKAISVSAAAFLYLAHKCYNAVVAATPAIARRFEPGKTVLVQNFPRVGEFATGETPLYQSRPQEVIYQGSITAIRGIRQMIEAMQGVPGDARLILMGGFETEELEAESRRLPGWDRVTYLGMRSSTEVTEALGRARAGLVIFEPVPNHIESQPTKLFQYMAAGIPIIASDFPLWREFVTKNGCGILVDPMKPEQIGQAIAYLLANPEVAEAMGRRGSESASRYQWTTEGEKLTRLYAALLASPRSSLRVVSATD